MKLLDNNTFGMTKFQVLAGGIIIGTLCGLIGIELASISLPIVGEGVLIAVLVLQTLKMKRAQKDIKNDDTVISRIESVTIDKKKPEKYWVKTEDGLRFHVYENLDIYTKGEWYCKYYKRTKIPYSIGAKSELC